MPRHPSTSWKFLPNSLVLLFATATLACWQAPPSEAQEDPRVVRILVSGSPSAPQLSVVPPEKTICRTARADCPSDVVWEAPQQGLRDRDVLVVRAKPDQPACFAAPDFRVRNSARRADSGRIECPAGSVWKYDVVLERRGQPIVTLDPAIVIDP